MQKRKNTSKEVVDVSVSVSQETLVDALKFENDSLKMEIIQLKRQIEESKKPKTEKVIISDETIIAEIQLARIKEKAFMGELTLEEIKKYDLLVKNKKLSEGNPTIIADYKRLPENVSEDELVLIASKPINE